MWDDMKKFFKDAVRSLVIYDGGVHIVPPHETCAQRADKAESLRLARITRRKGHRKRHVHQLTKVSAPNLMPFFPASSLVSVHLWRFPVKDQVESPTFWAFRSFSMVTLLWNFPCIFSARRLKRQISEVNRAMEITLIRLPQLLCHLITYVVSQGPQPILE